MIKSKKFKSIYDFAYIRPSFFLQILVNYFLNKDISIIVDKAIIIAIIYTK